MSDERFEAVLVQRAWTAMVDTVCARYDPTDDTFDLGFADELTDWIQAWELPSAIACLEAIARKRDELRREAQP